LELFVDTLAVQVNGPMAVDQYERVVQHTLGAGAGISVDVSGFLLYGGG
jgi:hypothetical protein